MTSAGFETRVVQISTKAVGLVDEEATGDLLFHRFLNFRTKIFTQEKGWQVWVGKTSDLDQYDQYDARYIVAYRPDSLEVIGGARLLNTNRRNNPMVGRIGYSYMIRDAYLEKLEGIPSSIASTEPVEDPKIWELTRLVSNGDPGVAEAILTCANEYLFHHGATQCLFLGSPAFMRMAKRMGYSPTPLGPISGNRDGRFLAFATDVLDVLPAVELAPNVITLHSSKRG